MYEIDTSEEQKPDFTPFTLNIRLTTKETAAAFYKMLEPIIYSRPDGEPTYVVITGMSGHQRDMAEDICNMLSDQVSNLNS